MRRILGSLMIAGLLITGAAGCSSDGSDGKKSDTPTSESDGGGGGGETSSGNADVQAYCEAVDEYVAKAKDVGTDAEKAQALTDEATELSEKATALATAGLSAEDAQDVADCTKKSTDALMPG